MLGYYARGYNKVGKPNILAILNFFDFLDYTYLKFFILILKFSRLLVSFASLAELYMDTTVDHFTPLALRVRGNEQKLNEGLLEGW